MSHINLFPVHIKVILTPYYSLLSMYYVFKKSNVHTFLKNTLLLKKSSSSIEPLATEIFLEGLNH